MGCRPVGLVQLKYDRFPSDTSYTSVMRRSEAPRANLFFRCNASGVPSRSHRLHERWFPGARLPASYLANPGAARLRARSFSAALVEVTSGVLANLKAPFRRDRTQIQDWPAGVFSPQTSGAASVRRGTRTVPDHKTIARCRGWRPSTLRNLRPAICWSVRLVPRMCFDELAQLHASIKDALHRWIRIEVTAVKHLRTCHMRDEANIT